MNKASLGPNEDLLIANLVARQWGKKVGHSYTFELMMAGGRQLIIGFRIFQGTMQAPQRRMKGADYRPVMYFDADTATRIYRAVKEQCPSVKLSDEYRTLTEPIFPFVRSKQLRPDGRRA